jgi:hypothetical protein
MAQGISRLVDEWEVGRLAHRYAVAIDRSDLDEWKLLFTDDVRWQTIGRPPFHGVDAVMGIPKRIHSAFKNTFHTVVAQHNKVEAETAEGVTHCLAYHMFEYNFFDKGRDPVSLSYNYLLRYEDRFRKADGVWKFSARTLHMVSRQVNQVIEFDAQIPPEIA